MQAALVTPPDITDDISLNPPPAREMPPTCPLRGRILSAHDRTSVVRHARITLWDRDVQCQNDGTFTLNLDALPSQFVLEIEAEGYHPYREILHPGMIDGNKGLDRDFFLIPLSAKNISLIVRSSPPVTPLPQSEDSDEIDLEELLPDELLEDDLPAEDLLEDCELLTDVVESDDLKQTAAAPELILDCQELKDELDAIADELHLTIDDARRLAGTRMRPSAKCPPDTGAPLEPPPQSAARPMKTHP